ncbi:MAG TPA: bifunctional histidinol-phosphatase/imidazoleglycerol-phosphate dehydratase, partial [Alistipes obesi]|nr:bifunctional histidinol-phosphatase/imidazoleglycerol-phosphate dehydratase [Alistipes communis]
AGAEAACALVAPSWERIAEFIRRGERSVTLTRRTAETQITLTLDLDGRSGAGRIATGIGFFDHML